MKRTASSIPSQPISDTRSRLEFIEDTAYFEQDLLKVHISEIVWGLMEDENVHQAELARRVGKSRAYLTKVLRGSTNFTLESVASILFALGYRLKMSVERRDTVHRRVGMENTQAFMAAEGNEFPTAMRAARKGPKIRLKGVETRRKAIG